MKLAYPFIDLSVSPEAELVHTAFRLLPHIREHDGTLVELHKGERSEVRGSGNLP